MSDDRFRDPSASAGSPRLTALALVIAAAATAGIALHPGLALADGAGPSSAAAAHRSVDGSRVAVVPFADDDQSTTDDPATDDGAATDGLDLDVVVGDDGAADEGTAGDDGAPDSADDAGTPTDGPIDAVVVDRRGRALAGPRAFAAGRTARGSKLRWAHWNDPTATATGRIAVKGTGRAHRRLRGTGTITLGRLTVCSDGTPVYRRAVFAVPRKPAVTVKLPGCSALR